MNADNLHTKIKMLERALVRKESEINRLKFSARKNSDLTDILNIVRDENIALKETIKRLWDDALSDGKAVKDKPVADKPVFAFKGTDKIVKINGVSHVIPPEFIGFDKSKNSEEMNNKIAELEMSRKDLNSMIAARDRDLKELRLKLDLIESIIES